MLVTVNEFVNFHHNSPHEPERSLRDILLGAVPSESTAKNALIDLLKPLEPHVRQTESTNIGAKPAPKFNFQTPLSVENLIARFYPAQARWEGFSSEQQ